MTRLDYRRKFLDQLGLLRYADPETLAFPSSGKNRHDWCGLPVGLLDTEQREGCRDLWKGRKSGTAFTAWPHGVTLTVKAEDAYRDEIELALVVRARGHRVSALVRWDDEDDGPSEFAIPEAVAALCDWFDYCGSWMIQEPEAAVPPRHGGAA